MKERILYWGLIYIFSTIHFYYLWKLFSFNISFYVPALVVLALIFYLSRKCSLRYSIRKNRANLVFFVMQLLVLILHIPLTTIPTNIVPFLLFIFLELTRRMSTQKIALLQYKIKAMNTELQNMNETFRIVRSERHDFMKHVSTIHFMLENEKTAEAKTYLNDLVESYEETNLSIKGENGSVAAVLHQMHRKAKANDIEVVYDMDLPLSTLPLSDQDKVSLIGNLLSNSIDASVAWQNAQNKQATITLQYYKRSGLFLLICQNNTLPIPTPILDELFHTYGKTIKSGNHEGLGTKMIHDIVKKHNGFLDFVHKNQEFLVKIKIPAIR